MNLAKPRSLQAAFVGLAVAALLSGCGDEKTEPSGPSPADYQAAWGDSVNALDIFDAETVDIDVYNGGQERVEVLIAEENEDFSYRFCARSKETGLYATVESNAEVYAGRVGEKECPFADADAEVVGDGNANEWTKGQDLMGDTTPWPEGVDYEGGPGDDSTGNVNPAENDAALDAEAAMYGLQFDAEDNGSLAGTLAEAQKVIADGGPAITQMVDGNRILAYATVKRGTEFVLCVGSEKTGSYAIADSRTYSTTGHGTVDPDVVEQTCLDTVADLVSRKK